ncbi:hypothetical protein ACF0H5_003865 [Mactra antiquata]
MLDWVKVSEDIHVYNGGLYDSTGMVENYNNDTSNGGSVDWGSSAGVDWGKTVDDIDIQSVIDSWRWRNRKAFVDLDGLV